MTERLFGYPPNRDEWKRLVTAIDLHEGFALFIVVVPDEVVGEDVTTNLQELAATLGISVERYSLFGPQSVISSLLAQEPTHASFVIVDLVASSWRAPDPERLAVALMQMNQRRDLIRARVAGPLLVFVDREGRRSLVDHAPDLFSVHAAEFRFSHGIRVSSASLAEFMLSDYEAAGLLGWVPGFLDTEPSLVPSLVVEIPELPDVWFDREFELRQLRALAATDRRLLTIGGLEGQGRTSLAAAYAREQLAHWDRVLWLDAAGESNSAMVAHSVLEAMGWTPPRTQVDLWHAFERLTATHRLLIIVDDLQSDLPLSAIGGASLVLAIVARPESDVRPRILRIDAAQELWRRLGRTESLTTTGAELFLVGVIVTLAGLAPEHFPRSLDRLADIPGVELDDAMRRLYYHVCVPCSRRLRDIPLEYLARAVEIDRADLAIQIEQLRTQGRLRPGRQLAASFDSSSLITRDGKIAYAILVANAEPIRAAPERPLHRRILRAAAQHHPFVDDESPRPESPTISTWADLLVRALLPDERPEWLFFAARRVRDPQRLRAAALIERLRLHQRPSTDAEVPETLQFAAALQRHEATLADVPFDPASSPSARVVDLLRRVDTSTLITEFPLDAVYAPPLDHFIAVGHAWHALRSERSDELRVALERVRASAERWGDPIALIRADLLDAEAQALAGDIQRSLATLDRLDARFDALFDPRGSEAIWLLQRRATLNERLGLYANAIELANEAWTRLRYVEVDDPDVLGQLARLFARHERSERALLALERWKLLAKDSPEQLLEALELEKQLLAKTNEAKLEAIDAQIAGLKRSVDAPS